MSMRFLFLALLLPAGCAGHAQNEAEAAERRLEILKNSGATGDERCAAEMEVAQAWLRAEDQERYERARLNASVTCRHAEMRARLGT
jgi:hypothetical protein